MNMAKNKHDNEPKKSKDAAHSGAAFAGGILGANTVSGEAAATDAMAEGMGRLRDAAARHGKAGLGLGAEHSRALRAGRLFEEIELAKYNADAARKGSTGGRHGPATDRVTDVAAGGKKFQMKAGGVADGAAGYRNTVNEIKKHMKENRGHDAEYVVPRDQVQKIREELPGVKIEGETRADGASSGGTDTREIESATDRPRLYSHKMEMKQVLREAHVSGAHAAAASAVIGGAISAAGNLNAYRKGDIGAAQAAENIALDTAKSGARGYATGAFGAGIRYTARKAGIQALAKSNIATAVASALIDAGVTVYRFAKGEISAEECAERLGGTTVGTLSSIYVGAAAGAVFGPPGAVVGSIAGYVAASSVYQASIEIFRKASLTEEEADRVVALCREAERALDEQRELLEARLDACLDERREVFDDCFRAMDAARATERPDRAIESLSILVATCGRELRLATFEEFDEFMTKSGEPIVL